jgi:hypothetical protein
MKLKASIWIGLLVLVAFATTASADPITYTFTTTGSGTIGAINFTNALATVTGVGDTSAIFSPTVLPPNNFAIDPTVFSISISGVGTATFTGTNMFIGGHGYIFDNQNNTTAGFGIEGDDDDILNSLFATYALATSIGPLAGSRMSFTSEATSLGSLTFTPTANGTFKAVVVPEPPGLTLILLGALLTAFWARWPAAPGRVFLFRQPINRNSLNFSNADLESYPRQAREIATDIR